MSPVFDKTIKFNLSELTESAQSTGAVLLIHKESGWTSFDVVAKIRRLTGIKKIGHAGTLDPLASGLLIVCLGRQATKTIDEFQALPKTYHAVIKLGATTATDDAESPEENIKEIYNIDEITIRKVINKFCGIIKQIPPIFSAKKVDGKRAYSLARKNIDVTLQPVKIQIYDIEVIRIDLPFVAFVVNCSKGTYIRSLARDIGADLGCGAYLKKLVRMSIGEYSLDNAFLINELTNEANN